MVRLKDIAERAGVSVSTVSQALRDHHSIGEATKARIRKIQAEMGYTRHLRQKKVKERRGEAARMREVAVVLIDRDFTDGQYASLFQAIISDPKSAEHRYSYLALKSKDLLKGSFPAAIHAVDGIIVSGLYDEALHTRMLSLGIPVLVMGNYDCGPNYWNSVEVDYGMLSHFVCQRLQQYGHRNVELVLPFPEMRYEMQLDEMFRRVVGMYGLSLTVTLEVDKQKRWEALRAMLTRRERPSVVFAASLMGAHEVMEVARECGVVIPEEINLCAFGFSAANAYFRHLSMWYADDAAIATCMTERLSQLMAKPDLPPARMVVGVQKWNAGKTLLKMH